MKATISVELFGDNNVQMSKIWSQAMDYATGAGSLFKLPSSGWVAEIKGTHPKYKLERSFLKGKKDYSKANAKGSRGVFVHFIVESDKYYEIKSRVSWNNEERYFFTVTDEGDIRKVDRKEVSEWAKRA